MLFGFEVAEIDVSVLIFCIILLPFCVGNELTPVEVAFAGMLFEKFIFFSFLSTFYMLLLAKLLTFEGSMLFAQEFYMVFGLFS